MSPPWADQPTDYPRLESRHLLDARLYADRFDLLAALGIPRGGAVAEVGVAAGWFSDHLVRTLAPRMFVAMDRFDMHEQEMAWGMSTKEMFGGLTHAEHYRAKFPEAVVEVGDSSDCLARYPDAVFDLIYVDAGHLYADVKRDAVEAARAAKADGALMFNDYVLLDPICGVPYGVVQAVNELVAETDWRVVGFALDRSMYCDIALRRSARGSTERSEAGGRA